MESQRQAISEEIIVVIHIGNNNKCNTPCPELGNYESKMHEATNVKYLGNIVTSHVTET